MEIQRLTEQEVRTRLITPAILDAGWTITQAREDFALTKGRIIARGGSVKRDEKSVKRADYILISLPQPHM